MLQIHKAYFWKHAHCVGIKHHAFNLHENFTEEPQATQGTIREVQVFMIKQQMP